MYTYAHMHVHMHVHACVHACVLHACTYAHSHQVIVEVPICFLTLNGMILLYLVGYTLRRTQKQEIEIHTSGSTRVQRECDG